MSARGDLWRRIEQRELQYMKQLGFPALDRLLWVVLKVRANPDGTLTDRIDSLMGWSGMEYRTIQRSLKRLIVRGVITRTVHGLKGGPRGTSVSWTTRLLPYDDWPTEGHASQASQTTKDTPVGDDGHAYSARRTRLATRDNQESSLEVLPRTAYFVSSPEGQDGTDKEHAGDDGAPLNVPRPRSRTESRASGAPGLLNARGSPPGKGDGARAVEILVAAKARAASLRNADAKATR